MIELATQDASRFALAQAEGYLEDCLLLRVLLEAGVDLQQARKILFTEVVD